MKFIPRLNIPVPVAPDDTGRLTETQTLESGLVVLKFLDMATTMSRIMENTEYQGGERNDTKKIRFIERARRREENFIIFDPVPQGQLWEVDRISVKAQAFTPTSNIAVFAGEPDRGENYVSSNVFTSGEYGRVELSQPLIVHSGVSLSVDVFNNTEEVGPILVTAWYRMIVQSPSTLNAS